MGYVQLRGAVGLDVSQYSHLYVGGRPDPRGNELEAGGCNRVSGEFHRANSDAAELPSGRALRHPIPGTGARVVRGIRRKRGGGFASPGGVRLVWNSDLDWRSEEHTSELQSRGHLVCRLLLE